LHQAADMQNSASVLRFPDGNLYEDVHDHSKLPADTNKANIQVGLFELHMTLKNYMTKHDCCFTPLEFIWKPLQIRN